MGGGPRSVAKDASFVAFVLDQLGERKGVRARAMFGGHGLYRGDEFFGIIHEGRLYFRVDDSSRPDYEMRGMRPFTPGPNMAMRRYWEVPLEVLEDRGALAEWADRALAAAPVKPAAKPRGTAGTQPAEKPRSAVTRKPRAKKAPRPRSSPRR